MLNNFLPVLLILGWILGTGAWLSAEDEPVLFRALHAPGGGLPEISIEGLRAKQGEVIVVLRRGPVGQGKNPEKPDRFGNYKLAGGIAWPKKPNNASYFEDFQKAVQAPNPKNSVAAAFPELPLNIAWDVSHDPKTGEVHASNAGGQGPIFVFDSPGQFLELTEPRVRINLQEPKGNGTIYSLLNEVDPLKQELYAKVKETIVTCPQYPDECLFVRLTKPETAKELIVLTALWLPLNPQPPARLPEKPENRDYWTAKFAATAFGTENVEETPIPKNTFWKYDKIRSMANFPSAAAVSRQIPAFGFGGFDTTGDSHVPVQFGHQWMAGQTPSSKWLVKNDFQSKYLSVNGGNAVVVAPNATSEDFGSDQAGFAGGKHAVHLKGGMNMASTFPALMPKNHRIDQLVSHKGVYYPDSLVVDLGDIKLTFQRVVDPAKQAAPVYLLQDELSVDQLVQLLHAPLTPAELLEEHWYDNVNRQNYSVNLETVKRGMQPELKKQPDGDDGIKLQWAKAEYAAILRIASDVDNKEACYCAWLFEKKWKGLKDDKGAVANGEFVRPPTASVTALAQLRPYFLRRWLQSKEHKGDRNTIKNLDGFRGYINGMVEAAKSTNSPLPDVTDAFNRYELHHLSLMLGQEFSPRDGIDPLHEPVTFVSPKMFQEIFGKFSLRFPTSAEWKNIPEQGVGNLELTKPWPTAALPREASGIFNRNRNVSEIVDDAGKFGFMGASYRWASKPDSPVPMLESAYSQTIGVRPLLKLPNEVVGSASDHAKLNVGEKTSELYGRLWGRTSPVEQKAVVDAHGAHEFWLHEHLSNVLYGAGGHIHKRILRGGAVQELIADQEPVEKSIPLADELIGKP